MAFDLQTILNEKISEAQLRAYCVRFDFGECQIDALTEILMDALVDYAFGFHMGILEKYDRRILKEAAKSLYKIKGYEDAKKIYLDNDSVIDLDDSKKTEEEIQYENEIMKKGEFGELLLHTYLRDYFNTIPLLSKIYMKDTDGFPVHGFDAVHIGKDIIDNEKNSLFLGESKIYYRSTGKSGEAGVNDLAKDIENHFYKDFLYREFALIAKKQHNYISLEKYNDKNTIDRYSEFIKQKDEWINKIRDVSELKGSLQELLNSVTIPIICTYESTIFKKYDDDSSEHFNEEYNNEINELHILFKEKVSKIKKEKGEPIRTNLNIILILLPIPSKKDFVKLLHQKTWKQQNA